MSISNYGELKSAVSDWLNRDDLNMRIPDFIRLAEADIFRIYSARGNEVTLTVEQRETPTGNEVAISDLIAVPSDYREMLTFTADGRPIVRVSLTALQVRQGQGGPTLGYPEIFARELDNFVLWPVPDGERDYELNYYAKPVALANDAETNAILTEEPGLYLYGALKEAEPFVRGDQLQLVQIWKSKYEELMAGVALERSEEDRSGSVVEVQNAFGAGSSGISRTGWS